MYEILKLMAKIKKKNRVPLNFPSYLNGYWFREITKKESYPNNQLVFSINHADIYLTFFDEHMTFEIDFGAQNNIKTKIQNDTYYFDCTVAGKAEEITFTKLRNGRLILFYPTTEGKAIAEYYYHHSNKLETS